MLDAGYEGTMAANMVQGEADTAHPHHTGHPYTLVGWTI